MANEVDNSNELNDIKELNEMKLKIEEAKIQREFMTTTLKSLACLFHDVAILRKMVKYLTFSIIALAVSFIFLSLLYWL